ncbi:MAG: 4'-phosphopantetheinyl transferase superfamily protein [Deltaproteobacteria bacterium]|nr:4'-phosphopantetheinyl transferase superfamily protein [Deltaproteobacteria bacterium]
MEEKRLVESYRHQGRRDEFLKGRWLLHALNPEMGPVLKDTGGMPVWPEGIRGSVSHKNGHVVVVTSSEQGYPDLGIDIEIPAKISPSIQSHICHTDDLALLTNSERSHQDVLSLIFSAKESLFKYCYPRSQTWFGFQDARIIEIGWAEKSFSIQLLKALPSFPSGSKFKGSFTWIESPQERLFVTVLWGLVFPFRPSFLSPDCGRTPESLPHLP